ncbi:DEAD/DEAH box helicase [Thiospirochaeta perfilievii]|uniref:DEAD/DEAH box helicase n=1 Tax=Thiospirochaeta perfilievii TaxID=252967 RepID=UPI001CA97AF5|nr:DEAD/DEAH box helicase [Thiospirochaeta perfilievii]
MAFYKKLILQSLSRTKEATLSMLGISNSGLREHLSEEMSNNLGDENCFLSKPVIEHTFGWKQGTQSFKDLGGKLLSNEIVTTLENAKTYSFKSDMMPYEHQIKAWETLSHKTPKSIVVTTGTGSGKTECFMIPILQDLIREHKEIKQPLIGVRALFLYPLNALINSQQERLNAWTNDYGSNIRFCLYNGKTLENEFKVRKEQKNIAPNQILSRELLRKEPSPILMTNATMLEYMLVRQVDNPILEISKNAKSLRWIVLDEAHTYVGSQAAEISLLLRRVVQAFGKKSKEIRFVATSATIAGEGATEKLRLYLSNLAGVLINQVEVITGSRTWPLLKSNKEMNSLSLLELKGIDRDKEISVDRYSSLEKSTIAYSIRDSILSSLRPLTIDEIKTFQENRGCSISEMNILEWIDLMTGTKKTEYDPPFLKIRMHLFQRMFHGLWSCIDPKCNCKSQHLSDWGFGNVYVNQKSRCFCGAPVYEVGFCNDCNEPHLIVEDKKGKLIQQSQFTEDEFSLSDEIYDESNTDEPSMKTPGNKLIIAPYYSLNDSYQKISFNTDTMEIGSLLGTNRIDIKFIDESMSLCSKCEFSNTDKGFMRFAYLGAPFYIANAVPTVLEYCPDADQKESKDRTPEELPGRGRKLITFTDSRQGTARMAVRMQQEAERSKLRGLVFEILRNAQSKRIITDPLRNDEGYTYDQLMKLHDDLKSIDKNMSEDFKNKALNIKDNSKEYIPAIIIWDDMVHKLSSLNDIKRSILRYNKYANPMFFSDNDSGKSMARLLLTREFSRRPKNQNSLESLGIVKVGYRNLDTISTSPLFWESTSVTKLNDENKEYVVALTLKDWLDFLKVTLDFFVRESSYIRIDDNTKQWMGSKFYPKDFLPPKSESKDSTQHKKWPKYKQGQANRLVKLLEEATGLDKKNPEDKDKINSWLEHAWIDLVDKTKIISQFMPNYSLDLDSMTFSLPNEAWICPVTNRLLDTTFCGLTPYLPNNRKGRSYFVKKLSFQTLYLCHLHQMLKIRFLIFEIKY